MSTVHTADDHWEGTVVVAVVGAAAAAIGAIAQGFWQWLSGKKKDDVSALTALMNGYTLLLGEFKTEREELTRRIDAFETEAHLLRRRINLLERLMSQKGIDVPGEEQ